MILFFFIIIYIYLLQECILKIYGSYNFKIMSVINYFIWFIFSIVSEYNRIVYSNYNYYRTLIPICFYSLNLHYIYELYFYRPDISHTIHHLLTIILQSYCYFSDFFNLNINIVLGCSAYWSMISSVFSALRFLVIKSSYKSNILNLVYKIIFIISKGLTIVIYYIIFYKNFNNINFEKYMFIYLLYFCVHLNQIYFIYRILSKYIFKDIINLI